MDELPKTFLIIPAHINEVEMELKMDEKFWTKRYQTGQLGWDIGYVSTPIKEYVDQLGLKHWKILVPGGGNSYEAEYLYKRGFLNTHVLDISLEPLENFSKRMPQFPSEQLHCGDFFAFRGQFDIIIEQTFFSAIPPTSRSKYAEQMHSLLKPGGKLVGLLFNIPLYTDRPPFGGEKNEYLKIFEPWFDIGIMEESHNSIPERSGNELFIKLIKKEVKN